MRGNRARIALHLALLSLLTAAIALAQGTITPPKEQFGFSVGDDYQLINYRKTVDYWRKLDQQSDRLAVVEIGKTAEARPMLMAIITSPENHKKLPRYKEIAARLAHAEGLTDEQARALAREGRAVVWIDGGLHATEVLGSQQLVEMVYQMVSRNDEETLRFLNDVILLAAIANPDGMDLVADWYMREAEPARRSSGGLPRLYHKYIGHDDNRDFYMSTQPETENINRIFYHEWFPQIVYNHHQTGPAGTVLFAPPFRDPFNYYFDPLVPMGIDLVSSSMHNRFAVEGKPGATMRSGASYSTWWNGGLRTTVYFHNMIGLLTEAIGNPTPISIPFVPQRQLPSQDLPYPIAPQPWHFRQSIEYEITANRAVMDVASKHREDFLFNIYRMGSNAIDKGSKDNWTPTPHRIEAVQNAVAKDREAAGPQGGRGGFGGGGGRGEGGRGGGVALKYYEMLRDPAQRDPRGFIIPSNQPDFPTATKFINTLIKTGITIHRATADFQVAGKSYPAGSYVVKTAQAFRAHVLDMFEPQDHPNDIAYPGGPPKPPYDSAGWTLAFQMGVQFDRFLEGFDGPFEKLAGLQKPPAVRFAESANVAGYLLSHSVNDAFIATNRLLKAGNQVYWFKNALNTGGKSYAPGAIFIPEKAGLAAILRGMATELGLIFDPVTTKPSGEALLLKPVRIGLWDQYGGSMPSGWVRWIFEQYAFPFEVVYPPVLDAGNLRSRFDVLVFVTGGIPSREGGPREGMPVGETGSEFQFPGQGAPSNIPEEFKSRLGSVTVAKTVPMLQKFLEEGGTIITIGNSTALAYHLKLPIENALTERQPDGSLKPLPREKYYIPGSLLTARIDNTHPLAYGMGTQADMFFDNSPVFRLQPEAALEGLRPIAWFDNEKPLHSGWAWGEGYLNQGVVAIEAQVGKGKLLLLGPEVTFRAQPHGTFKLLFNGLYYGSADSVRLP